MNKRLMNLSSNRRPLLAASPIVLLILILVGAAFGASANQVLEQRQIERSVALLFEVVDGGIIEGELINTTSQRVSDIEVLVRYSWVWHRDGAAKDDDPSWSNSFTFPIDLAPGESSPLTIPPLKPIVERDDGHYVINAKVMGYTRYRWVKPNDPAH